jgi:hypothetical protein
LATFQHLETKEPPVPVLKEKMGIGEPTGSYGYFQNHQRTHYQWFPSKKTVGEKENQPLVG